MRTQVRKAVRAVPLVALIPSIIFAGGFALFAAQFGKVATGAIVGELVWVAVCLLFLVIRAVI